MAHTDTSKAANFDNRTLWIGDNLQIMRGIDDEVVDLIYLDPPFNSKRIYQAPLGSSAAGAKFDDTWTMDSVKEDYAALAEHADKALWHTIEGAALTAGESMKAYLCFMALRLAEMHRILKPTGSVYLHCDPTASHYLKQLLDCIFGRTRFRNEIVWKRTSTKSLGTQRYARDSDRIFCYTKSLSGFVWNQQYRPHDPKHVRKNYRYDDDDGLGPYATEQLTGGKPGGLLAYKPFNGALPSEGRAWAPPRRDKFPSPAAAKLPKNYEKLDVLEKCEALDAAGLIHWSKQGVPRYKSYLDNKLGNPASDIITHIRPAAGDEATGWPTQKPLALLELVISASSDPGDWVLDPFAGCATTCIAAENLGRRWAGIDIDSQALVVTLDRLEGQVDERNKLSARGESGTVQLPGFAFDETAQRWEVPEVHAEDRPPRRCDPHRPVRTPNSTLRAVLWAGLAKSVDGRGGCVGCSRHKYLDDFELDHIVPRARGGADTDSNLQLLCGACNRIKGANTMGYLKERLAAD